ncbi:MAG: TonB-dependent receptor plug domain-containing protein [Acetobacteraceae bacterium]
MTGKPQRATDAPANIEIITQDDIRRSGATSIPEVLQFVTGVDVRRNGLANAEVGIRGYNQAASPRLMVLVDGRQVYMVDYGRIIWAAIPVQLDEIRQIEVIKGPNSALYGFNAVSGVINIITYDPLRDGVNAVTLRGGTQQYVGGSAIGTARIGEDAGIRVSLGGFRARDFGSGPLGWEDAAARKSPFTGTVGVNSRWRNSPTVELFSHLSAGETRLAEQAAPGVYDTERLSTNAVRVGLNADTSLGLLSLSAARSEAQVSIENYSLGLPVTQGEYQTTYVLEASNLVKIGTDHTVRVALEYRQNGDNSGDLAMGNISNSIYSASLMWDWQILPDLSLTNAVRYDHMRLHFSGNLMPVTGLTTSEYNSATINETSFNSGLVWKITDEDTLRVSGARGVQLPTLLQYGLQIPPGFAGGPVAYAGRPDLRPSIIWSAELDYDRVIPAIDSTLRTAIFSQRIDDIIAWSFGAPLRFAPTGAPVFFSGNVGYSTAAGVEIGLKGSNPQGFRWNLSYAFVATTDHTSLNRGPVPTGIVEYAHAAPRNVVIAGVGYTWEKLELDFMARWQSTWLDYRMAPDRSALVPVNVSNYFLFNARAGYQLTDNLTVSITAQQFNNPRLAQTGGPPVERRIIAGLTLRL